MSDRFEAETDEAPKKKKFNLYNLLNPDRKQDAKKEDPNHPRDLGYFFKQLGRRFSTIMTVNLMLIVGNFPLFLFFLVLAGYFSITTVAPASPLFPVIYGALQYTDPTPASAALFGIHGAQSLVRLFSTTDYILMAVGAFLLLFTFGPTHCGAVYIFRQIVRGEPVFLWADFKDTIRKNWKQGLLLGILDLLFLALIVYDIFFFYANLGSFLASVLFWASIFIGIFYLMMRMYIYLMCVTFDLKTFKLLKNALIFSLLGFKRNILALLGIALTIGVNFLLLVIWFPLGFIAPFILTVGIILFMMTYAAWPKIKEIMVDPYEAEQAAKAAENAEAAQ